MNLDQLLIKESAPELLKAEFYLYKKIKTDDLINPPKVNIQVGVDGCAWEDFEKNIEVECLHISKRIRTGTYFFKPFREVPISKDPNKKFKQNEIDGNIRIISIACIRDVLAQRVIYKAIYHQAELEFNRLADISFAYRKGKSAPEAAQIIYNYILDGYTSILDADIEGFFDNISHKIALEKINGIIDGEKNPLLFSYIRRFISVDSVKWKHYKGNYKIFRNKKPIRTVRSKGIPQGGVLSGLIANIFMHDFDKWVISELGNKFELKYVRYADDFVVLLKESEGIENVKELIKKKFSAIKLKLHPNVEKTKVVDLKEKGTFINFVGFSISPKAIRIKQSNIVKFKKGFLRILNETNLFENTSELNPVISRFTYKLLGNETLGLRKCNNCRLYEKRRSWFVYFSIITDLQQIKGLDFWIKKQLYNKFYRATGRRLKAKELSRYQLPRLERLYYASKKLGKEESCKCEMMKRDFRRDSALELLFNY